MCVKKVVRFPAPPLARHSHDVDQHFREGVARHRVIDSALHLEIEEQAAVAGIGTRRSFALVLESPERRNLFQAGPSSCFSVTQDALSVMIRRMTFGVMMTLSVNGQS